MCNERWNQLPADVQEKILDEYREINVESELEWWKDTFYAFKNDMAAIGIRVDDIFFSGFWHQGDGACFEGRVVDWEKFLPSVGIEDFVLAEHFEAHAMFMCDHRGRYYSEHYVSFEGDLPLPGDYSEEEFLWEYGKGDELRDAVLISVLSQYDSQDLWDTFRDAFKSHMRDLYRKLEKDYEYLTSDEAVLETLEANEMLDAIIEEYMEEAHA